MNSLAISRRFVIMSMMALCGCTVAVKDVNILWIGNSLTYVNELPQKVDAIMQSPGSPIRTHSQSSVVGGSYLSDHAGIPGIDEKTDVSVDSVQKIRDGPGNGGKWDYVVLQQQSDGYVLFSERNWDTYGKTRVDPITGRHYVQLYLDILANETAYAGGTLMFYAAFRNANIEPPSITSETQGEETRAYSFAAGMEKALCAPCGDAFVKNYQTYGEACYNGDGVHPSVFTQYTSACVFYSTLTNLSPVGLDKAGDFSQNITLLQTNAWDTYLEYRAKYEPLCTATRCVRFMNTNGTLTPVPQTTVSPTSLATPPPTIYVPPSPVCNTTMRGLPVTLLGSTVLTSAILTDEGAEEFVSRVSGTCGSQWKQCFNSDFPISTGGTLENTPNTFHVCCADKGPTLTVVRSGNRVFGGFAPVSWSKTSPGYVKANGAWLFRTDPTEPSLFEFVDIDSSSKIAMLDQNSGCMAIGKWGDLQLGADNNCSKSRGGYAYNRYTDVEYGCDGCYNDTWLAGSMEWSADAVEVYYTPSLDSNPTINCLAAVSTTPTSTTPATTTPASTTPASTPATTVSLASQTTPKDQLSTTGTVTPPSTSATPITATVTPTTATAKATVSPTTANSDMCNRVDCSLHGDTSAACVFGHHCRCTSPTFKCFNNSLFNSDECNPGSTCVRASALSTSQPSSLSSTVSLSSSPSSSSVSSSLSSSVSSASPLSSSSSPLLSSSSPSSSASPSSSSSSLLLSSLSSTPSSSASVFQSSTRSQLPSVSQPSTTKQRSTAQMETTLSPTPTPAPTPTPFAAACNGVDCNMHGDSSFCVYGDHCMCTAPKFQCANNSKYGGIECNPGSTCVRATFVINIEEGNNCEDEKYASIESTTVCAKAAKTLGLYYRGELKGLAFVPHGCSNYTSPSCGRNCGVWYNNNPTGDGNDPDHHLICSLSSPTQPPTQPPTSVKTLSSSSPSSLASSSVSSSSPLSSMSALSLPSTKQSTISKSNDNDDNLPTTATSTTTMTTTTTATTTKNNGKARVHQTQSSAGLPVWVEILCGCVAFMIVLLGSACIYVSCKKKHKPGAVSSFDNPAFDAHEHGTEYLPGIKEQQQRQQQQLLDTSGYMDVGASDA